jgi:hypothetical protein
MNLNYFHAILHLRPGARVAIFREGNYEDIDWGSETPIPQAELDAAIPSAQAAQSAATRRKEITARLSAIDLDSVRALRAKTAGKGKPQDDTKLTDLDAEAETLRAKLATL